jgi:hypothetical protein
VLLDPAQQDPAERIAARLREAGVDGESTLVRASLEDVFVAATGFGRGNGDRAGG